MSYKRLSIIQTVFSLQEAIVLWCNFINKTTYLSNVCFQGEVFNFDASDFDIVRLTEWVQHVMSGQAPPSSEYSRTCSQGIEQLETVHRKHYSRQEIPLCTCYFIALTHYTPILGNAHTLSSLVYKLKIVIIELPYSLLVLYRCFTRWQMEA